MRNIKAKIFTAAIAQIVVLGLHTKISQTQESTAISSTKLYVGMTSGCNAGVVTTSKNHLNCRTKPIGFTVSKPSNGIPLFVGITPNINDGVVTNNPSHLGGKTRFIGFTVTKNTESYQIQQTLYVGIQDGCNAGVVTVNPNHLGCSNTFIGGTYQP